MRKLISLQGVLLVIAAVLLLLSFKACGDYNVLVQEEEAVNTAWADLQSQYQRRADLIPNLVNIVKGYAKHENATLEAVVAARAKATQSIVDPSKLTPEQLVNFQNAQGQLSQALGKLLVVTENYPDLKANNNFSELQAQLEGTENRINESRRIYNESVKTYNVRVRSFPMNVMAHLFGFEKKQSFAASESAKNAPVVNFD